MENLKNNKYILIMTSDINTKNILKKSYLNDNFTIFDFNDDEVFMVKKITDKKDFDNNLEDNILKLVLSIAKKYKQKNTLTFDMSDVINQIYNNSINNKDKKIDVRATWQIKQLLTNNIITKIKNSYNEINNNNKDGELWQNKQTKKKKKQNV